jgi:hypothetical protein
VRLVTLVALVSLAATAMQAQRTPIRVTDQGGEAVAYAYIAPVTGLASVADSAGRAALALRGRDSLLVRVRRIGYAPLEQWVRLPVADTLRITMRRLPQALDAVEIVSSRNTPLARRGFYERMELVSRGATVGHFVTPEELEMQLPMSLTQSLRSARYVSIGRLGDGRAVLLGRGGCPMNILVDGQLVKDTSQDEVVEQVPTSITSMSGGGGSISRGRRQGSLDINSLVGGNEIAAIEVYPSSANAPSELQAAASTGRGTCGIVAIWTGGRK